MPEITKKHVKINMFFSFFAYSSKLVDMQKLVDSLAEGVPRNCLFSVDFLQACVNLLNGF